MAAYRTPDTSTARYLCTVCMRTASSAAGVCPRCGVERPALDNPQVVEELRRRAEARVQRRQARGWAAVIGLGAALAFAIYLAIGLVGWVDIRPHAAKGAWRFQLFHPILVLILFVVTVPIALVYKRRLTEFDVQAMTVPDLLRLVDVSLDV